LTICGQYKGLFLENFYAGVGHPRVTPHDPALFAPNMEFLGSVARSAVYRDKVWKDRFVWEAMQANSILFEEKYFVVRPRTEHMAQSISKYNRTQPTLNKSAWEMAGEWVRRHWRTHLSGARVESFEKCESAADKTTSAGYPWSKWYATKGEFMMSPVWPEVRDRFWAALATETPWSSFGRLL